MTSETRTVVETAKVNATRHPDAMRRRTLGATAVAVEEIETTIDSYIHHHHHHHCYNHVYQHDPKKVFDSNTKKIFNPILAQDWKLDRIDQK